MDVARDIVIIGAGVIGTSLATHLALRGQRPLVLERAHVCSGTTGQSGGVVRQNYSNPKTAALARDALAVFRNWDQNFLGSSGFLATGVMFTAGAGTEDAIRTNVAEQQQLGIDTSMITPEEAARVEPRINFSDCTTVCYEPTAGIADPISTNHAFAATARSMGVEIREQTLVTSVLVEHGRVTGVVTDGGPIPADIVIDAAGAWGLQFVRSLGLDVPVTFSRHPMALVRRPTDSIAHHPVVLDVHTDAYFLPRGEMTLIGKLGTMPDDENVDPDNYARGVTNAELDRYKAAASHRIPFLDRGTVLGGWAGIYDDSVDAHPVIDAVPGAEGLFCALGMSGNCFKLSPIIGKLLAERIIEGPGAAPELELFSFDRFTDGSAHDRAFGSLSVLA